MLYVAGRLPRIRTRIATNKIVGYRVMRRRDPGIQYLRCQCANDRFAKCGEDCGSKVIGHLVMLFDLVCTCAWWATTLSYMVDDVNAISLEMLSRTNVAKMVFHNVLYKDMVSCDAHPYLLQCSIVVGLPRVHRRRVNLFHAVLLMSIQFRLRAC
ncbi:hypothetical protein CC86DRAFT_102757 [Ophiobolus disseminans]|uniref:Uncharacterized protein n=1 Tax=Ophiobolus disseminans TaxID=1469910 RepID=A0A6A6ZJQ3_9PLEO|nr:hypothetical protein CC86DRAFT_102757 [Ophiobolus disseminans]